MFVPYAAPVVFEREVILEREVVVEVPGEPAIVEQPSLARLILDIDPPNAQVFADGFYIGIPEDFRFEHGGAVLEPGPHRIDILARDYEPVSFDVNLARGQSATFRNTLMPITRATQPAPGDAVKALPVAKQPSTFYVIPGCYIGNVPPKDANLPSTCDIARAVSFQYRSRFRRDGYGGVKSKEMPAMMVASSARSFSSSVVTPAISVCSVSSRVSC